MNTSEIYYTEMPSPVGTLGLRATLRGLTGIFFNDGRHDPLPSARGEWIRDESVFTAPREQLAAYFAGERTAFDLPIDPIGVGGTDFQRRVWAALGDIPYGSTISYGELARRIGQPAAVRAVGLANGRNPLSIIVPCHRVIGASGALTGYGGGMARKRLLLDLEARTHGALLLS